MTTDTTPSRIQVRRTSVIDADVQQLQLAWGSDNISEIVRRALRLAAEVNDESVDDVYMVIDGQRRRLRCA